MARRTSRYYTGLDEAIRNAKNRAKTSYCTIYIYESDGNGLFVRSEPKITAFKAVAKVKFDGTVEQLNQEEAAQ